MCILYENKSFITYQRYISRDLEHREAEYNITRNALCTSIYTTSSCGGSLVKVVLNQPQTNTVVSCLALSWRRLTLNGNKVLLSDFWLRVFLKVQSGALTHVRTYIVTI